MQERPRLGVAVRRLPNGVAVDAERDVVEEEASVHLRHVDSPLDAVCERVERADQIVSIDADVEREVVAGAGGNADERKTVHERGRGDDGKRAVAPGDAERVRTARDGWKAREQAEAAIGDVRDRRLAVDERLAQARDAAGDVSQEARTRVTAARDELEEKADELSAKLN